MTKALTHTFPLMSPALAKSRTLPSIAADVSTRYLSSCSVAPGTVLAARRKPVADKRSSERAAKIREPNAANTNTMRPATGHPTLAGSRMIVGTDRITPTMIPVTRPNAPANSSAPLAFDTTCGALAIDLSRARPPTPPST